jgi:hypothetical protein
MDWGHDSGIMAMWSFKQLVRFLAIPLAMTGFVLVASHAGGFVLRKDQPVKIDSQLISPNPRS